MLPSGRKLFTRILLHWKLFTTNTYKNRSFVVWITEFTCTRSSVSLPLVFPSCYCFPVATGGMSLYHYFKARDRLPDPKGSLSRSVSSAAIASANQVVWRVIVVGHFEVLAQMVGRYSSSVMYQNIKVLADRLFSFYSNLDKTLLTENFENKI